MEQENKKITESKMLLEEIIKLCQNFKIEQLHDNSNIIRVRKIGIRAEKILHLLSNI